MSLLRDLIKEMDTGAVTAAHDVAVAPGGLFTGGVIQRNKKRKLSKAHRLNSKKIKQLQHRNVWNWRVLGEMAQTSDMADTLSKLKAAEDRISAEDDTVAFGMEDEDGNIVKVYVVADQADEFESALATMLAGEDEDDDSENSSAEIAEILFQLKDKFDIIDVEWPQIEGDEEEEQEVVPPEDEVETEMDAEAEIDTESDVNSSSGQETMDEEPPEDLSSEEGSDLEMEPEQGVETALQSVIDMMKADAEARAKEAEARAKEAEARAAEANAAAAAAKVKQEEEVLDMEAYNAAKKEQEEEAKRLAQLAKWKHEVASDAEVKLASEEEEKSYQGKEGDRIRPETQEDQTLDTQELLTKILDYLQRN